MGRAVMRCGAGVGTGGDSESICENSKHVLILSCTGILLSKWRKTLVQANLENF